MPLIFGDILTGSPLCECWYILNYQKRNWSVSLFVYTENENAKNRCHIDDQSSFLSINQPQFWVAIPNTIAKSETGNKSAKRSLVFSVTQSESKKRSLKVSPQ